MTYSEDQVRRSGIRRLAAELLDFVEYRIKAGLTIENRAEADETDDPADDAPDYV